MRKIDCVLYFVHIVFGVFVVVEVEINVEILINCAKFFSDLFK